MGFLSQAVQKKYEKGSNYELGQSVNLNGLISKNDDASPGTILTTGYKGVVHSCVTTIAREIAKHSATVYQEKANGDLVEVPDHDLALLIARPNADQSEYDLAEATESYREMVGEYFIALNMIGSTNKPAEAYTLRPDLFTIRPDARGNVLFYDYNRPDGQLIHFSPEEIAHDKTFNPSNSYRGIGTIQANIRNVTIEDSSSQYTKSFFDNNATPAGIVAVKGVGDGVTFGDSAHKKLKQKWLDEFKGSQNAGKLAFLREAEVSYQQIGLGLDKIDMKTLRDMTEGSIYKAFGIPAIYFGDYANMNYASAIIAKRIFAENSIEPRLIKRAQMWQRLADRFWPNDNLVIKYENVVPEDREFKLEIAKNGSAIGLTEDEKREQVGFEPMEGKTGESVFRPMNFVEYGKAVKTVKFSTRKEIQPEEIVKAQRENDHVRKESYRSGHERLQEKYEQIALTELRDFLKQQNDAVKANIAPKKGLKDLLFNINEEDRAMTNALTPIVTQLYVESAELVVNFLGADTAFTPINVSVTDYIKNQVKRMASDFNEQTQNQLVETLTAGFTEGESIASLAKRVDAVYSEAGASGYNGKKGYRAERVARTEVIRSNNHATQESYRQLGIVNKVWFANPGACPQCMTLDGRIVGVTQNFLQKGEDYLDADGKERSNTYEDVAHSPLHANCRCTILPERV